MKTVAVLGGYGRAGHELCRRLLLSSGIRVVVAGRSIEKAAQCANDLRQDPATRGEVLPRYADASVAGSLRAVIEDADLLAVAAPVEEHLKSVVLACLHRGCGYVDLLGSIPASSALAPVEEAIWRAGGLFVTQAGLCPGLPSVAVKHMLNSFEGCRSIRVGVRISLKGFDRPEQVYGLVDAAAENRPTEFRHGSWHNVLRSSGRRDIDYSPSGGSRISLPFDLPELHGLAEASRLEELAAFGATPNWIADCALRQIAAALYRVRRGLGRRTIAALLLKAGARADSGATLAVHAWDRFEGTSAKRSLWISHHDVFALTGIVAAVAVRQYLDGDFRSLTGLRPMGHIVDAERVFTELAASGVRVDSAGSVSKLPCQVGVR